MNVPVFLHGFATGALGLGAATLATHQSWFAAFYLGLATVLMFANGVSELRKDWA